MQRLSELEQAWREGGAFDGTGRSDSEGESGGLGRVKRFIRHAVAFLQRTLALPIALFECPSSLQNSDQ